MALFVLVAAAGLAGDLLSKHCVFRWLLAHPGRDARQRIERLSQRDEKSEISGQQALQYLAVHRQVMPGVRFTLSVNPGVVFGLPMPSLAVNVATLLTVVLVLAYFGWSPRRAYGVHVALALILAGALGNWYDRLFSSVPVPVDGIGPVRNHVRDFIDCSQLGYAYVFNVADVYLVIGLGILILHWLITSRRRGDLRS